MVVDPLKAEHAVLDLSDLFRASLAKPGTLVPWADELALAGVICRSNTIVWRPFADGVAGGVPDDLPIPS